MYMVFKGWSEKKVRSYYFFPIDGDVTNLHIDNLYATKSFKEGIELSYDKLYSGTLSQTDIKNIRNSKLSNRELAERYDRHHRTIYRIRTNQSYQHII